LTVRLPVVPVDTLLYIAITRATWGLSVVEPDPKRFVQHFVIGKRGRVLSTQGIGFLAKRSFEDPAGRKAETPRYVHAGQVLSTAAKLTRLDMSGNDLILVPNAVLSMRETQFLDLSVNNLMQLPKELWTLSLCELNLSHNPLLGRVLLSALREAAQCTQLSKLLLRDVVTDDDQPWDATELCCTLKALKNLKHLDLRDNALGFPLAARLGSELSERCHLLIITFPIRGLQERDAALNWDEAVSHRSKEFNISEILIGDAGADKLAPELGKIEGLTGLYLSLIQIGDVGVTKLSAALKNMHSLTALNLDANEIGDAGVKALAPALLHMARLTKLRLDDNHISDAGATALLPTLRALASLEQLNLDENRLTEACRSDLQTRLSFIQRLHV